MKSILLENRDYSLTLSESCRATSLINKHNGEECLTASVSLPFFALTEERPYNNELKLAYMNKKTVFEANSVRLDGDILTVGFELVSFEALVRVTVRDTYIAFTLIGFNADEKDFPQPMTYPPVSEFRLIQLPFPKELSYGQWLNVCHTGESSVCVMSTSPEAFSDSERFGDIRTLYTDSRRGFKLKECPAVLICRPTDKFLDAVEAVENDFDLPKGVASRRDPLINASIYWVSDLSPSNLEEHISYAKKGGFRLMLIYYTSMFCEGRLYQYCGNYDYRDSYPEGRKTLEEMLRRIKSEGITPGIHFLHTHIGIGSRYVTPKADYRLNLTRRFTLARDISETDDEIFVEECPIDATTVDGTRLLRFGSEIITYEGYSEERPYRFYGCTRGHFGTEISSHSRGDCGGILDISEYGATSIYLDQNSDLQDEVGDKIADAYNAGFEFIYFDGSEGTNAPFEYHIPNAQYRIYKKLNKAPLFCEGAAKAHFGWHMLSGANAFDVFPTDIFKEMIIEHPFKEAAHMQKDLTRVNFGWWAFYADTRPDIYEFGTSKAAAWDCPATIQSNLFRFKQNPRCDDILETMRRWEDVRATGWLTDEMKLLLRQADKEFTLVKNAFGEYELYECEQVRVGERDNSVRAFVFSRGNDTCVSIWDDKGASDVSLIQSAIRSYTKEVDSEPMSISYTHAYATVTVEGKAYITARISKEDMIKALGEAIVKRH